MHCVRCQREIADQSDYCSFCGWAQAVPPAGPGGARRLVRPLGGRRIAGVCAGIADYLDVDPTLVRLAWIILSIVPGVLIGGALAYLAAWMVMPNAAGDRAPEPWPRRRLTRSASDRKVAGVCGGLAAWLGVDSTPVRLAWVLLSILPGAVIGGILAYLIAWFIMPKAQVAPTAALA